MTVQLSLAACSSAAAAAAAAALSELAGPQGRPRAEPATWPPSFSPAPSEPSAAQGRPLAGPQGRPQVEPATWSRQLTKEGLLEILADGLSDSTCGAANKQVTLARKLRELAKYLAVLLPEENQTTSLVLAFTKKDAMLDHLARMPASNRHLGTTAFKNALRVLQIKGPSAEHPLFWEIHQVIPRLLQVAQATAAFAYRRDLNNKKLAGANESAASEVTFQAIKKAVSRVGYERFDLLVRAASSWFHGVRMLEESHAEQLLSELSAGIPHHIDRAYPLLTRSQEDAKLLGDLEIEAAPAPLSAETLSMLSKFPVPADEPKTDRAGAAHCVVLRVVTVALLCDVPQELF